MDLGSNSFKMTVAQWAPEINKNKPFRVLHKERYPIQLGGSVFEQGEISPKDFKLAFKAVEKMQARLRDFSSPILRCVATSAIRDARNGQEFVLRLKSSLGLPVEVISGHEEARLIAQGLNLEYPKIKKGMLIDIGGGSTEIAAFGSQREWGEKFRHSLKVGSVRLATKFFYKGTRKARDLEKIRKFVRAGLKLQRPESIDRFVGSAGTIQSLGQIFNSGQSPTRTQVIRRGELDLWILKNLKAPEEAIRKRYKLQPSRARVIVPGAIILSEVMHWLAAKEIVVTGMSLRDGVMVDLVQRWNSHLQRTLKSSRAPSRGLKFHQLERDKKLIGYLEDTVRHFHGGLEHAAHVARLSLSVFDQMISPRTAMEPDERNYLLAAAYLHDIGRIVSESGHQKHSAYIVKSLPIPGFSPLERKIVALIALYHRKETPNKKDPLPLGIRGLHADQVRRLAAILRLVDGLDKNHLQNTDGISIRFSKKQAFVELQQWEPEKMDQEYFRDKASYFEEYFGCKLVFFVHHKRKTKRSEVLRLH